MRAFSLLVGLWISGCGGTEGVFYGTTTLGGASNHGTVFRITASGGLTTLYSFRGGVDAGSEAGLIEGRDGNLYATTPGDVTGPPYGTVFKITASGARTLLHSFLGDDGAFPVGGVIQGSDDNFYGTTASGGLSSAGTFFRITPFGALTTLYSFRGGPDGAAPVTALVQGSDGNFYGATAYGAAGIDEKTIFTITPSGTLTALCSIAERGNTSSLIQGSDGNFYGTTIYGGAPKGDPSFGTIFRITPSGAVTTLHVFSGSDGANPLAGLVQGSDGNFYGTTAGGGGGYGTVFRMSLSGALTTIHSFDGRGGIEPQARLLQGSDGNFYGTTSLGGVNEVGGHSGAKGTVFRITPSGVLTLLHSFEGNEGAYPRAGLVQAR